MNAAPSKQTRTGPQIVSGRKEVRVAEITSEANLKPLWSFSQLDIGGRWCWTKITDDLHASILRRLGEFESMTFPEMGKTHCHSVDTSDLIKDAQDRLLEIGKDDVDALYSLRFQGVVRVWAIQERNVLHLLWLDMKHEVCPSHKKHT